MYTIPLIAILLIALAVLYSPILAVILFLLALIGFAILRVLQRGSAEEAGSAGSRASSMSGAGEAPKGAPEGGRAAPPVRDEGRGEERR